MASPTTTSPARPFTYEDLEGMPDDGYRREIIGGSLIVSPSPGYRHQKAAFVLGRILAAAQPDGLDTLLAPFDLRTAAGDVLEPDVLVIRRDDIVDDRLRPGAVPPLVVEVLSPSNRRYDQLIKRSVYEEVRIPSYWLVDPAGPSLTVLRLDAVGTYRVESEVEGTATFATEHPFPVVVTPSELVR